MLSRDDNELLTRTGPGTPMGDYMRRFWIPALLSDEVERDGPPKRISLLGERLVAFRDSDGLVGLVDEHCPHRLASLYFGRNEDCGIRCIYHGWKFDVTGACLDMPNEPADSNFRHKVRLKAYPTRDRGGVIWTYMGPAEHQPADLPGFEWLDVPASHRYLSRWLQDCNYAQAMEGELDSSHVSFLHSRIDALNENRMALTGSFFQEDRSPVWKIADTDYGFIASSRRLVDDGKWYWRMNQWLLPFYTMITSTPGGNLMTRAWVPADDEHHWVVCITFRPDRPVEEDEVGRWKRGENTHRRLIPGTTRPVETKENEYLIDRHKQRTMTFSGIEGVRAQDACVVESAGPIVDRTREHLGAADAAIIAMRKRLMQGARALRDGRAPPLPANSAAYRIRAGSALTSPGVDFDNDADVRRAMAVV